MHNRAGSVLWGLGDHEGTIRDIVSGSSRAVVNHRKYDSFGDVTEWNAAVGGFASEDASGFAGGEKGVEYVRDSCCDPCRGRGLNNDR
jgi:hypothetical protein